MAIPHNAPVKVLDDVSASTTFEVSDSTAGLGNPIQFHKHKALVSGATGTWVFTWQESPDGGSTWVDTSDSLTINTGETGALRLNDACVTLRLQATRTSGDVTVHIQQHDDYYGAR